ncbi:pre-miRNA 5'-monophosphate methyltransferase [Topomyia yanbarensis]|uniref:pre-miRNA 5'-monophosphate methyltransferase n=1 Tax=Topomyia yanbarensis TaxID=2498891 RepID=UPI00273B04B5|nr:pre-miRNA 5'-monophosphate methyltransferase [Topomyia yanbarensis]
MMSNDQIRHGSYSRYYEFRSEDSRPSQLEQYILPLLDRFGNQINMLDIGCNRGKLTESVFSVIRKLTADSGRCCRMLGVDIDGKLVQEANREYLLEGLRFAQMDVHDVAVGKQIDNPVSEFLQEAGVRQFDIVFCFSILMYVHLNHGDEGLQKVLDYLCSRAKVLVIELQSWQKYRDHARRMRKEGGGEYVHYRLLKWKGSNGKLEEAVCNYVIAQGFKVLLSSCQKNEFNRNIVIFSRESFM